MNITESHVCHLAQLSRLSLTDDEVTLYTKQFADILGHAALLPDLHDHDEPSQLAADRDKAREYPDPASLLQNALEVERGFVKVPAILDKGSGAGDQGPVE